MQTLGLLSDPGRYGLATDLYQLTMAAAYWANGMGGETATFELFVRRLPKNRGYLIAAGLQQALEYLQGLEFSGESIGYLRALPVFAGVPEGFWELLRALRFRGDVDAIPEGTVIFPEEPLLRVRGTLMEAQLVETFLLSTLNFQTLVATKAARVVEAARGRNVVDFGARRAHGFDAAIHASRAGYLGGCVGTSNVLAGQAFGIPVYGTAAHSFTMAFADEREAFRSFRRVFPQHSILLIDTYDTLEGARRAASLGEPIRGVRLDSGDLVSLSRQVRQILDEAGQPQAIIAASGDLNEWKITDLLDAGAPIDLFGVGTDLVTSRDAPALGGVYKLVSVDTPAGHRPVRKLSEDKSTYPDPKQVWRRRDPEGRFVGDVLALHAESVPGAEPLLTPVMRQGALAGALPNLDQSRARAREQRESLPENVRRRDDPAPYPVELSPGLREVIASLERPR